MKRTAYIVVPFSILCIKYYPEIGRNVGPWATEATNGGIAGNKNGLGRDCLILGFFFFWHLLPTWRAEKSKARRNELLLIGSFLVMIWWLLWGANSASSLVSLTVGMLVIAFLGLRSVNKRLIGAYVVSGIVILLVLEAAFGISSIVIRALGRSPTLTGRTELWHGLLEFHTNPIFGVGFESFFLGERLRTTSEWFWWQVSEAHNGYLEIYLNLGLIGLFMLMGWIIATFQKSRLELLRNFEWGRFRMGFLAAAVLYNITESGFIGIHPVWFVFFLISIDYPQLKYQSAVEPSKTITAEEEMELTYSGEGV